MCYYLFVCAKHTPLNLNRVQGWYVAGTHPHRRTDFLSGNGGIAALQRSEETHCVSGRESARDRATAEHQLWGNDIPDCRDTAERPRWGDAGRQRTSECAVSGGIGMVRRPPGKIMNRRGVGNAGTAIKDKKYGPANCDKRRVAGKTLQKMNINIYIYVMSYILWQGTWFHVCQWEVVKISFPCLRKG